MTAREAKARAKAKQIPFGNDSKRGKGKGDGKGEQISFEVERKLSASYKSHDIRRLSPIHEVLLKNRNEFVDTGHSFHAKMTVNSFAVLPRGGQFFVHCLVECGWRCVRRIPAVDCREVPMLQKRVELDLQSLRGAFLNVPIFSRARPAPGLTRDPSVACVDPCRFAGRMRVHA